ncbi:adenosylmethionine-8-amino-7-oxononanoateaminotransferase-like protein [Striga asiatica]|uniref:Adenosylmethionine-8-amino-7-oxononanoateaminotransferase-like protein n=1 Tax=Striga asiatica TaxID=4170 RepID=A0A5A7R8L9_STRAF|nr:adenosylmethionine-8-amino-7-oxononanoateaminotransferase-like protein [Striga asiatica]
MPPVSCLSSAVLLRRFSRRSHFSHHRRRLLHSAIEYPLTHPIYTIWAANTSLGKTLVSAGLSMSFLSSSSSSAAPPPTKKRFLYLKPVQTGFPADSDSGFVYRKFSQFFALKPLPFSVYASNCVLKASVPAANQILGSSSSGGSRSDDFGSYFVGKRDGLQNVQWYEERKLQGSESNGEAELFPVSEVVCKTMYGWKEAVSPHLAAEKEDAMVEDSEVLDMLKRCLENGLDGARENVDIMCVIETAGGIASPGPSGSLQCDLYRPFRLPAILVGDGRLGGISGTISAYESLKLRGYDVAAVIFEDHGLKNELPLLSYFRNRMPVLVLPPIPKDISDDLMSWFNKSQTIFTSLQEIILSAFQERTKRLHAMPGKACDVFWWPFTQHKLIPEEKVTVIDSRCGENFAVHKSCNWISPQFDACASWWTQGPDANLQIELARDMGYTAARYGHVMFPENVYEPALELAELLLAGVGKGWASRVYFSDNGSTAVEIALKMAFRKFLSDNNLLITNVDGKCMDLKVLALRGSYHGDTLGAMEAQAPSPYTGILQQPWSLWWFHVKTEKHLTKFDFGITIEHLAKSGLILISTPKLYRYRGRGLFLDPPTVSIQNGSWKVSLPEKMQFDKFEHACLSFTSHDEIFKSSRNVVQGAGGMEMIDPLYQRILVRECKSRKIPVIFDEVFTGFWRLGRESAAEILSCQPDIACYAKLMTGGIIPLAATLAPDNVFDAFTGDSKLKALLHGHSYSAHAMGCAAGVKSVKWFKDHKTNTNIIPDSRMLKELWDAELVFQISLLPAVSRVVALGTLCAVELVAEGSNAGYGSTYASSLVKKLREDGVYMRPLGNVIYAMCGPCTSPDICRRLLEKICARIQEFGQQENDKSAVFTA